MFDSALGFPRPVAVETDPTTLASLLCQVAALISWDWYAQLTLRTAAMILAEVKYGPPSQEHVEAGKKLVEFLPEGYIPADPTFLNVLAAWVENLESMQAYVDTTRDRRAADALRDWATREREGREGLVMSQRRAAQREREEEADRQKNSDPEAPGSV